MLHGRQNAGGTRTPIPGALVVWVRPVSRLPDQPTWTPSRLRSGRVSMQSPVTVAGPRRYCTGFPIIRSP